MLTDFANEYYGILSALEALALFAGMLLCMELGRRLALKKGKMGDSPGAGAIDGAVFALLGLLIAFTFAGAYDRIEARDLAAIEEANAIGTAGKRLDLLPAAAGARLKALLLDYAGARVEEYEVIRQAESHARAVARTAGFKDTLWREAVAACRRETYPHAAPLVLGGLNQAFDNARTRDFLGKIHPPGAVYLLLYAMALLSAKMAGYRLADKGGRSWLHRLSFAAATSVTLFIILNLEHPLFGMLGVKTLQLPVNEVHIELSQQP
ncbi:MAG: hypothetical protein A2X32_08635 [Elusimicrobia bacterium GWC2_64_44]|nr:MAG: hypothetical protein A2X32_08635 [Elusimicrobia bacterium GWC2_64_44]